MAAFRFMDEGAQNAVDPETGTLVFTRTLVTTSCAF